LLSLICPWHCLHRGTETGAASLSCHMKIQMLPGDGGPWLAAFAALLRKCECLQISGSKKGLAWKAVAQSHLPLALLPQRNRDWGCLLVLPRQRLKVSWGWVSLLGTSGSPAPKTRTSADSSEPEGASLESCCSASSAPGTARTEAQRLWLLGCLATSYFKRILGMGIPARLRSQPCS